MALALNTSDPLYPALSYLFAVDDNNTVKELRAGLALTINAGVLLPNSSPVSSSVTPFGRSVRTPAGAGPYDFVGGVSFSNILVNTNGPISVFIAVNRYNGNSGNNLADMIGGSGPLIRVRTGDKLTSAVYPGVSTTGASTTGTLTTAQNTICLTRNAKGTNSVFMYLNGAIDPAFTGGLSNAANQFGVTDPPQNFTNIGGFPGQSWVSCDFVYVAIFVGTVLSAADVARLHSSLTGSNAFALIAGSAASAPTITTQPGTQTVTVPATATFTVAASGTGLSYQWQRNGVNIAGATASSFTTPATSVSGGAANSGDTYRCVVTNSGGSATSTAATLTVNAGSGSGVVVSDVVSNGSGTVLANTLFSYSYFPGGRFGSMAGITPVEGTVTSASTGRCTVSGLPAGSGVLLLANRVTSAATDNVYYQAVTVT